MLSWLSVVVIGGPSHMAYSPKTACGHATQIASSARSAFEGSCDGIEEGDLWLPATFEPCLTTIVPNPCGSSKLAIAKITPAMSYTEEESKKLRDTAQDVRKALDRI